MAARDEVGERALLDALPGAGGAGCEGGARGVGAEAGRSTQNGASAGDSGFPSEIVALSYGKIKWTYTQQKRADGAAGGNVTAGWDLTTNKTIA